MAIASPAPHRHRHLYCIVLLVMDVTAAQARNQLILSEFFLVDKHWYILPASGIGVNRDGRGDPVQHYVQSTEYRVYIVSQRYYIRSTEAKKE